MKGILLNFVDFSLKSIIGIKQITSSRRCLTGMKNIDYSYLKKQRQIALDDNIVINTSKKDDEKQEISSDNKDFIKYAMSDKILLKSLNSDESSVPSSSLSRAVRFSWLGVSMIGSAIPGAIKSKILSEEKSFKNYLLSESNSEKLSRTLCKMRGAALKFGQLLSTFEDVVIPEPLRSALEKARQDANSMPNSQLMKILNKAYGPEWKDNFIRFDIDPFAAASIGQVHYGEIKNELNEKESIPVAIKIQFPGVATSIESDLSNLKRVFKYLNVIPKGMYIDKLVDNLGKEIKEECDYLLESDRQEHYRNLISNDNHLSKVFIVPKVIKHLSNEHLIVSEFIPGVNIDEVDDQSQEVKDYIGSKLLELCLREIFIFRYMQTDPNPANFFLIKGKDQKISSPKGVKLGLVDFGAARDYNDQFVNNYMKIIFSATHENKEKVLSYSKDLGFLTGFESEIMLNAHANSVFAISEPFSQLVDSNTVFDFGNQKVTSKIYKELPTMLKHRLTSPPTEIYSLHRRLSGAFLMCIKLKSKVKSHKIFKEIVNEYEMRSNIKLKDYLL